jgi:hypothetical protein
MPDEVLDIEEHHSFSEFYDDREKQRLYHESGCKFRAQIGGMGGGKTFAQIVEALRYCLLVPGCDCLIIRRTFPDLEKSVIRQFLKIPDWVYGGKRQYNNSKHVVNFPNGSKLTFGYCEMDKDVNQYLSTEYVFIGGSPPTFGWGASLPVSMVSKKQGNSASPCGWPSHAAIAAPSSSTSTVSRSVRACLSPRTPSTSASPGSRSSSS